MKKYYIEHIETGYKEKMDDYISWKTYVHKEYGKVVEVIYKKTATIIFSCIYPLSKFKMIARTI